MKGSIRKRGLQTYQLRLSLGYDDVTGKRLYKFKTVHCEKKEAERQLRKWVTEYEGGQVSIKDDRTSVTKLLEHWIANSKVGEVSESSIQTYETVIRHYITPHVGKVQLFRLSAADIRELFLKLRQLGLGVTIVKLVSTILRQALDVAVSEGRIAVNPILGVKKPKRKRELKLKLVRSFTPEQASLFLEAAAKGELSMMFKCALLSGMRPGEYIGLTWPMVDWESSQIRVEQAAVKLRKKRPELSTTKTEESRRTIAMPEEFMAELRAHREHVKLMKRFAGAKWTENDLVFPTSRGTFFDRDNLVRRFKTVLRQAGLPKTFRLYDLRHSMATLLLSDDENIKVVAERLGHESAVQTLKTYSHALPNMQRRAATKLGTMFYPSSLSA